MAFSSYYIGGYFRLNYHRLFMVISGIILLMDISGYFINIYWCFLKLNYHKLLVVILLMAIVGYFIVGHWWLSC
jgi:hypothetical protein